MFKKLISLLGLILIFLGRGNYAYSQGVVINELMQSNIDYLMVEKDFPDSWVELYNGTASDVNIKNWYVGLDADYTVGYKIPADAIITAGGHLVLYCDKEATGLHTDFRLESGKGGSFYLFDAAGNIVDSMVNIAKMPAANIAYGRVTDGADTWQYEVTPTAGASNNSVGATSVLPDPVFSVAGGVQNAPVALTVSMPAGNYPADTRLYVTLDGSEPTLSSNSYTTDLTINITTTTVVRAKLISAEALTPRSVTHSYIYHPRTTTLPIISIVTEDANLYSDEYGILSEFEQDGVINYKQEWRRPVNAEYFDMRNGGVTVFNQLGETALSGGASRNFAQKSMKLYANKRFGTKRYTGAFWDDKPAVVESKSFILRNGGNNCDRARFADAMLQKVFGMHTSNLDWQAYQPVIVYINGQYKGEYGMRERSNEDYVAANYNGLEDIEIQEAGAYFNAKYRIGTLYESFYNDYMREDVSFAELSEQMDVDNFMEALIAEMFSTNRDYPHNNVSMWRPLADGGKWRWILKDIDFQGLYEPMTFNMFNYMFIAGDPDAKEYTDATQTNGRRLSHDLYIKMISFPEFSSRFIDKYATYLGDFLKPSVTISYIDEMDSEIRDELGDTYSVNCNLTTVNRYIAKVNVLKDYWNQRPMIVYSHMAEYFNLGTVIPMTLAPNGKDVKINNVGLTEGDFDGAYFSDRQLNLKSGAANCGWKMTVTHSDGTTNEYDFEDSEIDVLLSTYYSGEEDEITVAFQTVEYGPTEFEERIADLGIDPATLTDQTENLAPVFGEPQCAYINIVSENGLPTSGMSLDAYVDFYDNAGGYMRKDIVLAQQGSDADNAAKKNLSVMFKPQGADDMDVVFGTWVPQNEFLLKGFYNDGLRGTAEIAYELYDQIMGIEDGARMTGDAFPCVVYVNGNFEGVYAWQLKKHRKNMNLTKDDSKMVWLDGTLNDKQLFNPEAGIGWTKFSVRNPKDLYNMDGTEYDVEDPQELLDEACPTYDASKKKQKRCAEAKARIVALSNYYSELMAMKDAGATDEEMREAISERFDIDNLKKYMVFSLATNNYNGFKENWQWYTTDGSTWRVAPFDCDHTFGYNDTDVTTLWTADKGSKKYDYKMENVYENGPIVWLTSYFWEDVKEEWMNQRQAGVLTHDNIMSVVNGWINRVPSDDWTSEWTKWSESPVTDNAERVDTWVTQRLALEDEYLGYCTYDLTVSSAEWATICVPFAFEVPEDMYLYTVGGVLEDGETLAMTYTAEPEANKPYLLHANEGTYNLYGMKVEADTEDAEHLHNGYMVGTYSEIYVPQGDYVLQAKATGVGFYRVGSDNTISLKANRAYISKGSMPAQLRAKAAFRVGVDDMPTGLKGIEYDDNSEIESIYSVDGIKTNKLTQGLNIVIQKNGKVNKVIK